MHTWSRIHINIYPRTLESVRSRSLAHTEDMVSHFRVWAGKGVSSQVSLLFERSSFTGKRMLWEGHRKSQSPETLVVRRKKSESSWDDSGRMKPGWRDCTGSQGVAPASPLFCPKGHAFCGLAFHSRGPLAPGGPLYSSRASPPGGEVELGRNRAAASSREIVQLLHIPQTPNSRESRRLWLHFLPRSGSYEGVRLEEEQQEGAGC